MKYLITQPVSQSAFVERRCDRPSDFPLFDIESPAGRLKLVGAIVLPDAKNLLKTPLIK